MTLTEKLNALLNIDADIDPLFQALVDCAIALATGEPGGEALYAMETALDECAEEST